MDPNSNTKKIIKCKIDVCIFRPLMIANDSVPHQVRTSVAPMGCKGRHLSQYGLLEKESKRAHQLLPTLLKI